MPTTKEIISEQKKIDDQRKKQVDEIIDALKLSDVPSAIAAAKAWCMTALQETNNAAYYRERAEKAENAVDQLQFRLERAERALDNDIFED